MLIFAGLMKPQWGKILPFSSLVLVQDFSIFGGNSLFKTKQLTPVAVGGTDLKKGRRVETRGKINKKTCELTYK